MGESAYWGARRLVRVGAMLSVLFAGCGGSERELIGEPWRPPEATTPLHPVTVAAPASAGGLSTALRTPTGDVATIGCPTCHVAGTVEPLAIASAAKGTAGADESFHAAVAVRHGDLVCASCHVEDEPQRLRLASGATLAISASIQLCSQCHGPIRQAFDHGAHGGMRGYWDRQRGPRTRNDCVTCHSPHRPAYPDVTPVAGPRDRFIVTEHAAGSLVERRFPQEQVQEQRKTQEGHETHE